MAEGAFHPGGKHEQTRRDGEESLGDGSPSEKKMTEASETAVRKLLNPLSREQLVNILAKLGSRYEFVFESIKHTSETDPSRTKLFVRELAWATTSEKLRSVFSKFGEIEEAVVIKDRHTQRSRGFGFVRYKTAAAAIRALQEPAKEIDGRMTQCNLASLGNPFKQAAATTTTSSRSGSGTSSGTSSGSGGSGVGSPQWSLAAAAAAASGRSSWTPHHDATRWSYGIYSPPRVYDATTAIPTTSTSYATTSHYSAKPTTHATAAAAAAHTGHTAHTAHTAYSTTGGVITLQNGTTSATPYVSASGQSRNSPTQLQSQYQATFPPSYSGQYSLAYQ